MRVARDATHQVQQFARRFAAVTLASLVLFGALGLGPIGAAAQSSANVLEVDLAYPDDGLLPGEQLCLALYPGSATDFNVPPLQSRCLDPGATVAAFAGLAPGAYQLVTPSVGSVVEQNRYQVQAAETSIPADAAGESFFAQLPLVLVPELSGTTGQVQLNVFGCPPGTDREGDATLWQSTCTNPVAGVAVTLQGIGSIEDTAVADVTSDTLASAGKVSFANLPPGEYQIAGVDANQFTNVDTNPALVVRSNIDGSLGVVDPAAGISLRPAEVKNIDIYLMLTEAPASIVISPVAASIAIGAPDGAFASGNPSTATAEINRVSLNASPVIEGGLSPEAVAARAATEAAAQP